MEHEGLLLWQQAFMLLAYLAYCPHVKFMGGNSVED